MKRFEKCLKTILLAYSVDCIPLYCPDFPDIKSVDFQFLAALKLISLEPGGDDTFYAVPTEKGITYFYQKKYDNRHFWKEHVVNFVGGFISGVLTAVLAAAAVQILL